MNIQGTFSTKVMLNGKVCAIFVNKNNSIVDVREIVRTEVHKARHGKMVECPIFSNTRPEPFVKNPDSIHPTVVDFYHMLYGRNL